MTRVYIRRPEPEETPLSDAEKWIAIRDGIHGIEVWLPKQTAEENRQFPGRVVWIKPHEVDLLDTSDAAPSAHARAFAAPEKPYQGASA